MGNLKYPFGAADVQDIAAAAVVNIVVVNGGLTYARLTALTAATTINVTVPVDCPQGAQLIVELPSGATARDTTFGTGFTGAVVTGVINKTKVATFRYIGTSFVQTAVNQVN